MGAIAIEDGDNVLLKDDRRRKLLVGAAMMCECMLVKSQEEAELEFIGQSRGKMGD